MAAPDDPTTTSLPGSEAIPPEPAPDGARAESETVSSPETEKHAFSSADRYLRWRRLMDGALVAVVLLLAFELGLFPIRNSDLLMHRAVGRLIAHGDFDFHSDPFAYTTEGARWVDHSWLFGLFAYGMHQIGEWGDAAFILLKAVLLAALAETMLRLGRRSGRSLWIPALCTGLALLAVSPRVFLQPGCVSYLFLALTLFLLDVPRRRHARRGSAAPLPFVNVRWLIPLVCVLWVNIDAWFLLGPVVIALYLVGELLEGPAAPKGSVANLAAVLGVSVLACLANPYHVYAFRFPDQLGLSPAGEELKDTFSGYFLSPVRNYFYININRSVAGLAYYPLVFAGLASFILTPGSWRNWRGPVWLGLLLLSAWHGRAVPFFAVAAGPITSLNFLDVLGNTADVPADPDRRRRLLSVRFLTLLLGISAFTAGSAGWLHTPLWGPNTSPDSRRPGWWAEFDDTLARAATKVAEWRQHKLLPADARFFNTSPVAADYFAWYAPGARVFIDGRLSIYPADVAGDFRDARDALLGRFRTPRSEEAEDAAPAEPAWARVLRDRNIDYLIVGEGDLSRGTPALLQRLINQQKDWTLCYLYGGTGVFGWKGAKGGAEEFNAIRYDAGRLAFGPDPEKAPPVRPVPAPEPTWWEIIWQPERPRSAETDNAHIHMVAHDAQNNRRLEQELRESLARLAASPTGPIVNGAAADYWLFAAGATHEAGPPAELYLAIRAARRALKDNPEDGRAWFHLGQAYVALQYSTRERKLGGAIPAVTAVRQVQIVTALLQAVRKNPDLEPAHALLADQFQQRRFIDLTLHHREAQLKALITQVYAMSARGENDARLENEKQRLEALQAEVNRLQVIKKEQEDRFEIDGANLSPVQKAQLALQRGLSEAALKAARDHVQQMKDEDADPAMVAPGMDLAVRMLIETGEMDEARVLVQGEGGRELLNRSRDSSLPVLTGSAGDWYRVLVDAASGDYADADSTLEDLVKRTGQVQMSREGLPQRVSVLLPASLGMYLLERAIEAGKVGGIASGFVNQMRQNGMMRDGIPTLGQTIPYVFNAFGREGDLQALRGLLALEAGDIKTARSEFSEVQARAAVPHSMMNAYHAGPLAEMALDWIKANAGH